MTTRGFSPEFGARFLMPHSVYALIALYFFGLYYNDALRINRMEEQAESLVAQLATRAPSPSAAPAVLRLPLRISAAG